LSAISLQSPAKEIKVESYVLKLMQTEERVTIELRPQNTRDVDDADVEWLSAYLHDAGKWEKLVNGFQTLLNTVMGLHQTVPRTRSFEYDIQTKAESYAFVLGSVGMPYKLKKALREHGADVRVLVNDLAAEIANVPNWRALMGSWNFMKEQFTGSTEKSEG
jgi:hypothetical protein